MKPINHILHFAFLFLPLAFNMPGSANNHDPYSPPANPLALNGGCITSGNQTIHYEDIPAPITATPASGGSCSSYSYQWQWSTNQIFWTDIAGATSQNLTFAQYLTSFGMGVSLPETVYYHRRTICGSEVQYTPSVSVTRAQLYYNTNQSGYYYPNNCGFGETPQPYYVQVLANTFSAGSVSAANALAVAWAQQQANTYGTCASNVSLWYSNNSNGDPLYVIMTNTSTNQQYYFELPSYTNGWMGDVPEGTYNIEFYDYYGWYYRNYEVGCGGYEANYPPVYMYNRQINSSCNTFNIYSF